MTQPPEGQGEQSLPPLQPFVLPGQPPADAPPAGNGYGQSHPAYRAYPTATTTAAPRDPVLADWWQRLAARVIDGVAVTILAGPIWLPVLLPLWHRLVILASHPTGFGPAAQQAYIASFNHTLASLRGALLLTAVATAAVKFGYDWLQHRLWGQTLGKRALGIKVVMAGSHAPVTTTAAGSRAAAYALAGGLPYVGFFWWVADCLWLLWDPQRQCLHDKAGRTVVVKKHLLAPMTAHRGAG